MKYDFQMDARLTKPCPCCGSQKIYTQKPEWVYEKGFKAITIECGSCGLQLTEVGDSVRDAYRNALIAWNRRTKRKPRQRQLTGPQGRKTGDA